MPELPEVETIVRELNEVGLIGLQILRADIFWNRSIGFPTPEIFLKQICGQKIRQISRRGKYIVFTLSQGTLLVHLRMTGKFFIDHSQIHSSHERIRLYLSDGRILHYEDQRKFGKWILSDNSESFLKGVGIEPLSKEFTLQKFKTLLKNRHRKIKPFLLDQSFIAGLGNIYVDEALWLSKIHPSRHVDTLSDKEIKLLHQAIISVLKSGIENTGTTLGSTKANYYSVSGRRGSNQHALKVFRCEGRPCPRCKTIIEKTFVAQRGTHFCPKCQI